MILHHTPSYYSAAKAPYLARFRVQPCSIHVLESLGMGDNSGMISNMGPETWQAAIFKVGDDVRQVGVVHN